MDRTPRRCCPYCESDQLERLEGGTILRCRDCGRSSLPGRCPSADDTIGRGPGDSAFASIGAAGAAAPGHHLRGARGAPAEVSPVLPALWAVVFTALFFGALRLLPPTRFSELFIERGWVPYVITLISVWALLLLAAKLIRLRRERAVLTRELVAGRSAGGFGPDDVESVLMALRAAPPEISESFLAQRIARALRHFRSRRRAVEVVEFLATEARADELRVDASYGLVRVFVWAVPTLGFIGTVIGIGAAVAGFSATLDAASSLDGMKASIGIVTGGLGVAFDTTLLALVMSILIMFPANAVQRIEEAFLGEVDDYCAEYLVPRLDEPSGPASDEETMTALARRLLDSMRTSDRLER
ncbi:MAG TPA: hypothetical protein ENI85_00460 [Deltaproteobacteria bacterium]|nr:hypothetical protein [Deltaproteobacteria bacterium]